MMTPQNLEEIIKKLQRQNMVMTYVAAAIAVLCVLCIIILLSTYGIKDMYYKMIEVVHEIKKQLES